MQAEPLREELFGALEALGGCQSNALEFREWSIRQVRALAQQPAIARQIEQRRATLLRQLDRLDADAAQQALAHDRAVEAVERDLALLDEVSPPPSRSQTPENAERS